MVSARLVDKELRLIAALASDDLASDAGFSGDGDSAITTPEGVAGADWGIIISQSSKNLAKQGLSTESRTKSCMVRCSAL